jgi:hypothetical protein
MDIEKIFSNAEKNVSHTVWKGPYMKALCKALRKLIPDDECIKLDLGEFGIAEVDGVDIGVHLLCLLKDIPDSTPVIDPRPCEGDPNYNEETANTDLSSIGLKYPE